MRTRPRFQRFAWAVLGYNLIVILWGAFVRATGSGAGCGNHWPLCNGELVPHSPAFETVIELTHRLTSGIDGILVLVLLVLAWRIFPRGHPVRLASAAAFVFLIAEALVGAGLVKFELVVNDDSVARATVISFHLLNTFLLLGSLTLTAFGAGTVTPPTIRLPPRAGWLLGGGLAALMLLGISGAVTALGDTLFPAREFSLEDLSATAHFLLRLRIFHPVLALTVGFYVVFASLAIAKIVSTAAARRATLLVIVVFLIQLGSGWINVRLAAPVWMQLVHLFLADLLWIAFVVLGAISATTAGPDRAYT